MRRRLAFLVCALGAMAFVGCGDDDSDGGSGSGGDGDGDGDAPIADCSTFAACGGDIVGSWTIQEACLGDFNPVEDFCSEATVDLSSVSFSGSVEYLADGTYSVSSTQSGSVTVSIPASCLTGVTDCNTLDSDEFDCSGDATDSCDCTSSAADTVTETGTYATSGNDVTLTPTGDDPETSTYCVEGDVLKLRQTDEDLEITFALTRN